MDANEVIAQAKREYQQEVFRERVEAEKARLRQHRSWWQRLFPYRIIIVRIK
jgi:hypothetical protein